VKTAEQCLKMRKGICNQGHNDFDTDGY